MRSAGFQALRESVLSDPEAQGRLREAVAWDRFAQVVAELAAERGIALEEGELELARGQARRAWIERGI
jgi:hypothetical protein